MIRVVIAALAAAMLAGCAGRYTETYPAPAKSGYDPVEYQGAVNDCNKQADAHFAKNTLGGAALGAAAGAVGGAILGAPGTGAAVGAAVGGTAGAGKGGVEREGYVRNCMRARGFDVY